MSVTDLLAGRPGAARQSPSPLGPYPAPDSGPPTAADAADAAPESSSALPDSGQLFVTELLRREGRADEPALPARPSWVYRLVAALSCFALLFGAVLASTAALSGPRTERVAPSNAAPASIAGAEAVRADLIDASVGLPAPPAPGGAAPAAAGASAAPSAGEPAARPVPAERTVPNREALPPAARPDPASEATPRQRQPGSAGNPVLGTVTTFYENVAVSPWQAFTLLDPQMRGSGYTAFRTGWTDVEQVTVDDIRLDGPNAALVTVSLTRSDGTVLHTVQRVLVTPGAAPRITDARLLSASRS